MIAFRLESDERELFVQVVDSSPNETVFEFREVIEGDTSSVFVTYDELLVVQSELSKRYGHKEKTLS